MASSVRDRLKDYMIEELDLHIPEGYENKHPSYPIKQLQDKLDKFCNILHSIVEEFGGGGARSDQQE